MVGLRSGRMHGQQRGRWCDGAGRSARCNGSVVRSLHAREHARRALARPGGRGHLVGAETLHAVYARGCWARQPTPSSRRWIAASTPSLMLQPR
jgi:hypothetical protein